MEASLANFLGNLLTGIFGSRNQRLIKRYNVAVRAINALEESIAALEDAALSAKTQELRNKYRESDSLDSILVEAFAVVREASKRALGMRHFDVQLIGGLVLHEGKIAEMRTGEGKTLVATLPAYLNAIAGNGVHIVTVNDYLAQRDAQWMGPVYEFLGLTVGVVRAGQSLEEKRAAYAADVTYGTNNEFGFDYLRDNLAFRMQERSQRGQAFAIVDEVDSILIDEARTPLIISGRSEESTELYVRINKLIPKLDRHDVPPGPANEDIQLTKFELLDVDGSSLGEHSLSAALGIARERGLHLINSAGDEPDDVDAESEADETSAKPAAKPARSSAAVCRLYQPGDYSIDEKTKQAHLTEEGHERVEELFVNAGILNEGESLYDASNIRLMHHLTAALRAHALFRRDVEYVVSDDEVVIVDEFTGRTMPGRRWSDGLHQAIEAKEGVRVKEENQTVASITFQNYFRLYNKLAGMTGTADTEAYEFQQIYGLEVVVIPTHMPMVRDDAPDLVYLTADDKFEAIIEDIRACREEGQPVLVGTTTIETSEYLSKRLKKEKIPHEVLNAKQHEREAEIVAQAGRPGSVTIATNMAGRGTDIVLGGNLDAELTALGDVPEEQRKAVRDDWQERHEAVVAAGGLHIVGTERHESRRIDNQLRGRSGRQGDAGSSRFYLSMEDNLMRIFGDPERTKRMLSRAGMKQGEAIESKLLSRQIERAQRKVEAHNFDIRKQLLEYDDVANDQRKVVYEQRSGLMEADEISDAIEEMRTEVIDNIIAEHIPPDSVEEMWDKEGLQSALESELGLRFGVAQFFAAKEHAGEEELREAVREMASSQYAAKEAEYGPNVMREVERQIMLRQLDTNWKEHIAALDYLRQYVGLRAFAQKNPKQEYKREAFEMFSDMLDRVKRDTITILSKIQISRPAGPDGPGPAAPIGPPPPGPAGLQFRHAEAPSLAQAGAAQAATPAPGGGPMPQQQRRAPGQMPGPAPAPGALRQTAAGSGPAEPFVREGRKLGRNEPCHCGSGKKFKQCHGKLG
jgi:preprotein translocase subunit SecA